MSFWKQEQNETNIPIGEEILVAVRCAPERRFAWITVKEGSFRAGMPVQELARANGSFIYGPVSETRCFWLYKHQIPWIPVDPEQLPLNKPWDPRNADCFFAGSILRSSPDLVIKTNDDRVFVNIFYEDYDGEKWLFNEKCPVNECMWAWVPTPDAEEQAPLPLQLVSDVRWHTLEEQAPKAGSVVWLQRQGYNRDIYPARMQYDSAGKPVRWDFDPPEKKDMYRPPHDPIASDRWRYLHIEKNHE